MLCGIGIEAQLTTRNIVRIPQESCTQFTEHCPAPGRRRHVAMHWTSDHLNDRTAADAPLMSLFVDGHEARWFRPNAKLLLRATQRRGRARSARLP
jgi:hypothetical protein